MTSKSEPLALALALALAVALAPTVAGHLMWASLAG